LQPYENGKLKVSSVLVFGDFEGSCNKYWSEQQQAFYDCIFLILS